MNKAANTLVFHVQHVCRDIFPLAIKQTRRHGVSTVKGWWWGIKSTRPPSDFPRLIDLNTAPIPSTKKTPLHILSFVLVVPVFTPASQAHACIPTSHASQSHGIGVWYDESTRGPAGFTGRPDKLRSQLMHVVVALEKRVRHCLLEFGPAPTFVLQRPAFGGGSGGQSAWRCQASWSGQTATSSTWHTARFSQKNTWRQAVNMRRTNPAMVNVNLSKVFFVYWMLLSHWTGFSGLSAV